MDTLELTLGIVCLGLTIYGIHKDQVLLLMVAGIGWVALGFLLGDAVIDPATGVAVRAVGIGMSLVCFVQPLVVWLRKRSALGSPEERDYESYKRKVLDVTQRRF